ncbi:MAG TPA: hypothetical protein VHF06_30680 [Pseudonocardiaceae bacterium]|nr:hypothetical protein [Pseudonocardiaceae bacterium]
MTGNNSGWTDPGIYAQPQTSGGAAQPQPTQQQTNDAYDQYGLHHYHGNVKNLNQVNQDVSKRDQSKYGPLFGPILNLVNGTNEVDGQLSATAKNLKEGLDIRSAPSSAGAHYPGISHQELYDSVTKGVDPGAVGSVSDTWLGIGNKLADLQNTVAQSIASSQVTWTGHAAEQARQSIASLGNQSGKAGQSAQLAGVLTAQQSEALTTAKNTVPPPPKNPFNPQAAQQKLQTITDPVAYAQQAASDQAQASAQQAAHQLAAHVVQQYDQTISQTSANMPAFAPAPHVTKPPPTTHNPLPPVGTKPPSVGSRPPTIGSPTNPTNPHSNPPETNPIGIRENPISVPTTPPNIGDQTTTTSSALPTNPNQFGTPPGTTTNPFGTPSYSGTGGGGGPVGFGGLPGGFGGSGGGGGGFGGSGGGSGSGSGGLRGLGSGSGASGAGGRSGIGAGAAAAEEAAEGATGARGAAGASGMGGMGAGRGQRGKDDAEHKRPSWLLEEDEGIFGTDELTAPPVIGE